ncbi:signal recognition particle-docking protein FtsY [Aquamicrobium sp. LC103]|nr:signal recognition particle-docking protein FtsY [Aquamicrobium sp. LC103]
MDAPSPAPVSEEPKPAPAEEPTAPPEAPVEPPAPEPEPEPPVEIPVEEPPAPQPEPVPPIEPVKPDEKPVEVPSEPAVPAEVPTEPEPAPAPRPVPEVPIEVPEPAHEVPDAEPVKPVEPPLEVPTPAEPETPRPEPQTPPKAETLPEVLPSEVSSAPTQPAPEVVPPPPVAEKPNPAAKVTVSKAVERKAEPEPAVSAPTPRVPWFQRLREGLSRSSRELRDNISGVFTKRKLDEDTLQDLEDVLIRADLGMETAIRITDSLASGRFGRDISDTEVRTVMAEEVEKVLAPVALPLELDLSHKPHVVLVVGVNGTGKTTTIGKLAAKLTEGGLSVTLAAGDTFRAAAIEQLKIWGERTGSPVIASKLGADAAGLAWDAWQKAKEAGSDVLIIDTAGRLQNKAELMAELEKIVRVLGKHDPEAPHTVLQTVDATTGQNALNQVEIFRNVAGVNGLVMTKLDGTARGGILVAIAAKHKLPVYFIGVGEQVDDLEPFSASDFAKAIAGVS